VNPNALTGIGAIIVPDSPIRIRKGRSSNGYGLISGQQMMERNRVMAGSQPVYAGIKTMLPAELQTVAVLAQKKSKDTPFDSSHIAVQLIIDNAGVPEYSTLQPAVVIDGLYEAAVLFNIPANTGYSYYLVYTKPAPEVFVTGVLGLKENVQEVKDNWEQVVLQPAIPYPYVLPQKHTTITVSQ
jgi:hypothetical protein